MTHLEIHDSKIDRQGDGLSSSGEGSDHGEDIIDLRAEAAKGALGAASSDLAFGRHLARAREHRGLSVEACGQALRLPVRLLQKMEQGDYDGVDYQVYLPGYLCKYGRYVGIDQALIDAEIERVRPREPALVAASSMTKSRYLFDRYATATTYIVLTAVIVVPLIWLGVRGGLGRDMAQLAPLDTAPVAAQHLATPQAQPAQAKPAAVSERPLQASMAPFSALDVPAAKPATPEVPAAVNTPPAVHQADDHTLSIRVDEPSWVEITAADGKRLEYSLLPAGTHKTYDAHQPLDVRIGNADGTTLTLDGKPLALSDYRRDNVAHLHIRLSDGQVTPASL